MQIFFNLSDKASLPPQKSIVPLGRTPLSHNSECRKY